MPVARQCPGLEAIARICSPFESSPMAKKPSRSIQNTSLKRFLSSSASRYKRRASSFLSIHQRTSENCSFDA